MKVRQDAWSHEDDVLLAETVLRHIKEGSTQLLAFDEVGDELNRTSAACGFRWNAVVRLKYINQIAEAKKERKERKRHSAYLSSTRNPTRRQQVVTSIEGLDMDMIINYLQNIDNNDDTTTSLQRENDYLLRENLELLTKTKELETELEKLKKDHGTIEEDYQSLIQIMNRARRMAILQEDEPLSSPTFKMDKNGNLEKVAK
ncbi:RsfA family transcriptional regulator [Bacillus sp. FJAT-45350]|uniref:RsfA family transcriptional regulator n=1 Tax=Bacillus sp. FJAT-45350 TaxID=2011014 RepID=UPI000BB71B91|nr:RsfA family transcriptional regulator [Bacillus sp. FJAT-45350]